eukprot:3453967-Rhodomonas_salina.2
MARPFSVVRLPLSPRFVPVLHVLPHVQALPPATSQAEIRFSVEQERATIPCVATRTRSHTLVPTNPLPQTPTLDLSPTFSPFKLVGFTSTRCSHRVPRVTGYPRTRLPRSQVPGDPVLIPDTRVPGYGYSETVVPGYPGIPELSGVCIKFKLSKTHTFSGWRLSEQCQPNASQTE